MGGILIYPEILNEMSDQQAPQIKVSSKLHTRGYLSIVCNAGMIAIEVTSSSLTRSEVDSTGRNP